MPSQKQRSKEDTWTTDELNRALNKTSERRHHRDRDEDRKKDRINGEDRTRRHRDEDSERRHRRHRDEGEENTKLTEDDRERLREERRRKREDKDGKKGKDIHYKSKPDNRNIEMDDSDDRRRRHHGEKERRHDGDRDRERHHRDEDDERHRRHRDDDDRDKRRRQRDENDDAERRRRHHDDDNDRDKRRRHRDEDGDRERHRRQREEDEEDERERRRQERRREREDREEEERRRRHEEKKERRKDEDREKRRDREDRSDRHREDRSERHKDRRDRETEEEREARREREREERRREREERHRDKKEDRHRDKGKSRREEPERESTETHRSSRNKEEAYEEKKEDEDEYEDDFEDYEEDFEEDVDEDEAVPGRQIEGTLRKQTRDGTRLDYSDSEVNDVLKALDAENERLLSDSTRSPQLTRYGRGRDYTPDRDDDSDPGYEDSYQPRQERPRTAINFVSAKQRALSKKAAGKTMQRWNDLLKMIELDKTSFDILDLPPVNEYDLYIRAFGGSNTRQAYVQTNDDNVDRDIQTEEVDARQKWTQHPPEDFKGYGRGDGEKDIDDEEEDQSKHNREQDLSRLNKFLEKAGQVIAILLEEGKEDEVRGQGRSQTHINVSEGYTQLDLLPILQGRHVIYSYFSPVQPSLLATVYSPAQEVTEDNPVSKRGVICVWNTNQPNYPQNPVKPSLLFAGMVDGSVAMWDLREPSSIHQSVVMNEETYSLRYPTYDTAGVLNEENHHSPVSCIVPIYSYTDSSTSDSQAKAHATEDTSSGMSFQLVSTEESAVLHFWVVAEIGSPDPSGSQNDFGLIPGGGVKLLKSSSLTLENPVKESLQSGLRALDMSIMPADPNHFYVSTDSGNVLHGIRFGKRVFPRAHSSVIESVTEVVSIDFSPFGQPCFLAGSSDGVFSLYNTKSANPLISWPSVTKGCPVQCIRWSRSRPCVFYVLDTNSTLYVFDILEGDVQPKQVESLSKDRITSFSLTADQRSDSLGGQGRDPQLLFSTESGQTEIHTITKALRDPEQLETDYLASYIQRF